MENRNTFACLKKYNKVLLILSLCFVNIGNCFNLENSNLHDVMLQDGSHPYSPSKRSLDKVPCQPMPRAVLQKIMGAAFNPRYMSIERPGPDDAGKDVLPTVKSGQKDQGYPEKPQVEAFHVHGGYTRILYEEPIKDYYFNSVLDVKVNGSTEQDSQYKMDTDTEFLVRTKASPSSTTIPPTTTVGRHHGRRHHQSKLGQPKNGHKKVASKHPSEKATLDHFKMDVFEQAEPPVRSEPMENVREEPVAEKFVKSVRGKRAVKSGFPWFCDSKIEWIDLGADHFPRFLRSVVCTNEKCWFGHFQCRPKAFTVKVLRRRKDSCNPDKTKKDEGIVAEESILDINSYVPLEFREQWVFEERAVTFCCECAA